MEKGRKNGKDSSAVELNNNHYIWEFKISSYKSTLSPWQKERKQVSRNIRRTRLFPNVSQFCYMESIVSKRKLKICFYFTAKTYFASRKNASIKQNWKRWANDARASNVSGNMFSPCSNIFCLWKRCFPFGKTGNIGETCACWMFLSTFYQAQGLRVTILRAFLESSLFFQVYKTHDMNHKNSHHTWYFLI